MFLLRKEVRPYGLAKGAHTHRLKNMRKLPLAKVKCFLENFPRGIFEDSHDIKGGAVFLTLPRYLNFSDRRGGISISSKNNKSKRKKVK